MSIFDHGNPVNMKAIFNFPIFAPDSEKQLNSLNRSWERNKPIFDNDHPKIIEVIFSFSEFVSESQK